MRILILGGTGAMGIHVSHLLVQMGHQVVVTSRRQHLSENSDLTYRIGNAKDQLFLNGLLAEHWDAIIDFMIWSTTEFKERAWSFLETTSQYVFLSSYRVYADSPLIRRIPRVFSM